MILIIMTTFFFVLMTMFFDNNGKVSNIVIGDHADFRAEYSKSALGTLKVLSGKVTTANVQEDGSSTTIENVNFLAIPYYSWAHRGRGEMAVWLSRTSDKAIEMQKKTAVKSEKH